MIFFIFEYYQKIRLRISFTLPDGLNCGHEDFQSTALTNTATPAFFYLTYCYLIIFIDLKASRLNNANNLVKSSKLSI
jgi:hypothetical protein